MDKKDKEELQEWADLLSVKIDNLHEAINKRFEAMKKVVGDYLEISSNLSIGSLKNQLKNV